VTDPKTLADKLRSGQPVITGWSMLAAPIVAELFARSGYEAVTLDLQHGMHDFTSASDGFAALALGGAHRIARIPVDDNATASRLADMGAECLIAPMINSRADAEAFVKAVKYPPVGERSWAPFRVVMLNQQTPDAYLKLQTNKRWRWPWWKRAHLLTLWMTSWRCRVWTEYLLDQAICRWLFQMAKNWIRTARRRRGFAAKSQPEQKRRGRSPVSSALVRRK
jgi:hypothetical protein